MASREIVFLISVNTEGWTVERVSKTTQGILQGLPVDHEEAELSGTEVPRVLADREETPESVREG